MTTPPVLAGPFVDTVMPGVSLCVPTAVPFNSGTESSLSRFKPLLTSTVLAVCPPGVGAGVGIGVCLACVVIDDGAGVVTDRGVPTPAGVIPDGWLALCCGGCAGVVVASLGGG